MQAKIASLQDRETFSALSGYSRRDVLQEPLKEIVQMLEQNLLAKFKRSPEMLKWHEDVKRQSLRESVLCFFVNECNGVQIETKPPVSLASSVTPADMPDTYRNLCRIDVSKKTTNNGERFVSHALHAFCSHWPPHLSHTPAPTCSLAINGDTFLSPSSRFFLPPRYRTLAKPTLSAALFTLSPTCSFPLQVLRHAQSDQNMRELLLRCANLHSEDGVEEAGP